MLSDLLIYVAASRMTDQIYLLIWLVLKTRKHGGLNREDKNQYSLEGTLWGTYFVAICRFLVAFDFNEVIEDAAVVRLAEVLRHEIGHHEVESDLDCFLLARDLVWHNFLWLLFIGHLCRIGPFDLDFGLVLGGAFFQNMFALWKSVVGVAWTLVRLHRLLGVWLRKIWLWYLGDITF